jgi:hypothetical protein
MADLNDSERRHRPVRLGIFQKPAQEKVFGLLEPWLAQENYAEQQDHEHDPDGGSVHRGKSEE